MLRPIASADAEQLHALWTSAGVRRFLWDDEIITPDATRAAIAQSERLFADHRFGLWGAFPLDTPRLCGFAGLWFFRQPPELELLYGIAEDCWHRGYATEIAQAVLDYAFNVLEMPVVSASTDPPNLASIRVLEKLGFSGVRRGTAGGRETVFFELKKT